MSTKHRRYYQWLILLLVMVLAFAVGCRSVADTPEDPTDPVEEPADPDDDDANDEPADPPRLGRVIIAQDTGVGSWDPPVDWSSPGEWIIDNAYDRLLDATGDASDLEPLLAHSWEPIDEVTTRFYLREGVRFHDGTEFTAEDVKYHFERVRDGTREQYIQQPVFQFFDDIVIHDPYTFDFVTPNPDTLLYNRLHMTGSGIVSKAYVEAVGTDEVHRNPMGTGPFKLMDWARDEFVLFEANDDYWGGRSEYDELMFRIIPEASTRVAELLTGGVHLVHQVPPADWDRVRNADGVNLVESPTGLAFLLIPRLAPNPAYEGDAELDRDFLTEDVRIREAIELAIDKQALIEVAGGVGEPIRHRTFYPLPEANPDLYGAQANLHDPDRARAILEEAGYGPGEARLVFHARSVFPQEDLARVITDMLEQVGFEVELRILDASSFATDIYEPRRTQELALNVLGGGFSPRWGAELYRSDWLVNVVGPPREQELSERVDELLEIAFSETLDNDRRLAAYHEVASIVAEQRWNIGLYHAFKMWGISDDIQFTPRVDEMIRGQDIQLAR